MTDPLHISRIDAWAYRCPIERTVSTSFGVMYDRPAVFLRIEDMDGAVGWGEIWANWPAAGAEHRVNLLALDVAPLILGHWFREPQELFHMLEQKSHIRAVQCGELGPFRQVIAGIDMAVWDLLSRRAGVPLRTFIRNDAPASVPTYASGIQISAAHDLVPVAREAGYRTFKLKVGFDITSDITKLSSIYDGISDGEQIAADANQAWTLDNATRFLDGIGDTPLEWLEEAMPVFASSADWTALAERSPVPLAGGGNLAGKAEFSAAIDAGSLSVIQPDVAKWGGITGCLAVARQAMAARRRYCPHFLGGGLGLIASAELLAATGGDGKLEVDVNPNPLRSAFFEGVEPVSAGQLTCSDAPGLGVEAIPESLAEFVTLHREIA